MTSSSGRPRKAASNSEAVMTELVLPVHTNALDTIFGGVVMSWIDVCAAIAAQRFSGQAVVTASLDEMSFVAPVYKGWVVNLWAKVNYVAKSSMEVGVRVDAENPLTGVKHHTASAYLTFVALGPDGKPTQVPELILESEDDRRRHSQAAARREHRLLMRRKKTAPK